MTEPLNWQHVLIEGAFVVGPVLLGQWFARRQGAKAAEKREQKLDFILTEYGPHSHAEENDQDKDTPLLVGGLRFPRSRINGGGK